jgi:radical SAM-linked protein
MAFTRANIPVMYTKGFNPLARMEFASPLSTGISASAEMALVDFLNPISPESFISDLNRCLPQGFHIENAACFYIPSGMKKYSLSSLLWGFGYKNTNETDYVIATEEKAYRQGRMKEFETVFSLNRNYVLARNITVNTNTEGISYFDAYESLYKRYL